MVTQLSISAIDMIIILLIAFIIDLVFGEPPFAIHPVVWIGKLIGFFKDHSPDNNRKIYGIFMSLCCILFAAIIGIIITVMFTTQTIPLILRYIIAGWFLKMTFAITCLTDAGKEIYNDLIMGDIAQARNHLSMYVSRNTSQLTQEQIASAVIETSSENFVDGILSPVFYFAIFGPFGLIAAYMFKSVSTLDSMVGYKNEQYLKLGWFAARFDDILNWIPARLCLIPIFLGTYILEVWKKSVSCIDAVRLAIIDGENTPSPNSGYPMAAFAGAMHIRLEKPNVYILGKNNPYPQIKHIQIARILIFSSTIISFIMFSLLIYLLMNLYLLY